MQDSFNCATVHLLLRMPFLSLFEQRHDLNQLADVALGTSSNQVNPTRRQDQLTALTKLSNQLSPAVEQWLLQFGENGRMTAITQSRSQFERARQAGGCHHHAATSLGQFIQQVCQSSLGIPLVGKELNVVNRQQVGGSELLGETLNRSSGACVTKSVRESCCSTDLRPELPALQPGQRQKTLQKVRLPGSRQPMDVQ